MSKIFDQIREQRIEIAKSDESYVLFQELWYKLKSMDNTTYETLQLFENYTNTKLYELDND